MPKRRKSTGTKRGTVVPRRKLSKKRNVMAPPPANVPEGLLALPLELFDMILAYYRKITMPDVIAYPKGLPPQCNELADALRALSQTCHSLRARCLARAWEHVEACVKTVDRSWYRHLAEKVPRLCDGLVDNPQLAMSVQTFSLSISSLSVLSSFADCLHHLPALTKLRLVHVKRNINTPLKNTFRNRAYPQITSLVIPTWAHNILRACPNARVVICNGGTGSQLVSAMKFSCPKVETVMYIRPSRHIFERLAIAAPKLEVLVLVHGGAYGRYHNNYHHSDIPRSLASFKKLHTLKLDQDISTPLDQDLEYALCEAIMFSGYAGRKMVVIRQTNCPASEQEQGAAWKVVSSRIYYNI